MKLFVKTVFFHFLCILIFAFLYFYLNVNFIKQINSTPSIFDYFLLSTTIQSGVGITDMYPNTDYGKIIMIIQQLIKITTHVFTVYLFSL